MKTLIPLFFLIFLTACSSGPGPYDDFAKCLTEQDVIMFGTDWCPHCKEQKEWFENSFQYVNYVNCDKAQQQCLTNGVKGYPTWKINGESYPGKQPLNQLAQLSGCDLYASDQSEDDY